MPRQLGKHTADHFVADGISVALIFLIIITTSLSGAISDHYDISFLGAYLLLALINYRVGGNDVFYPGFLYSVLWLTTLTLLASFPIDVDALSERTEFLLFGCCTVFSLSCFVVSRIAIAKHVQEKQSRFNDRGGKLLVIWLLAVLPLFVLDLARAAGGFGPDFLSRARLAIIALFVEGKTPYSSLLTSSAPSIAVMACLASAIDRKRTSKWITRTLIVLAVLYAVMTTGRPQIVQIFAGLSCIYLFGLRRLTFIAALKKVAIPICIGVAFLIFIPLLTKVEVSQSSATSSFVGQLFLEYLVGSVPALDTLVTNPVHVASTLTFQPLALVSNKLFGTHNEQLVNWFVYIPFPMNTYTAYRPYLIDFGLAGPIVFSGIIGMFHGLLYKIARRGSDVFLFLFAIYLYPLVMTIFDDQYTGGLLLHHVQIILFATLYFGVLRDFSKEKLVTLLVGRASLPSTSRFV